MHLNNYYTLLPQHKNMKNIDPEFLTWFLGFFEGDGCFHRQGYVQLTQSNKDTQVLYKIKTTLGFGVVRKNDKNTDCWKCYVDQECAARMTLLFNGNIVTNHKLGTFKTWVNFYH